MIGKILKYIKGKFETDDDVKIFISLFQPILTFLTICIAITSVIISTKTLMYQLKSQEQQKQTDMTFRFENRFQNLITVEKVKLLKGEILLQDYLYSYWAIQSDQYMMNKYNSLQPEAFDSWMRYRHQEYLKNDTIYYYENDSLKGISFRSGFEIAMKRFDDPEFYNFFKNVVFTGNYKRE